MARPGLAAALEALVAATDARACLAADPLRFPRRYRDPADAEVAALLAAALSFGGARALGCSVAAVLAVADAAGGPRAWVEAARAERPRGLPGHRWVRGDDLALFAAALGELLRRRSSLAPLFAPRAGDGDVGPAIERGAGAIAEAAEHLAGRPLSALPRGVRALLPRPSGGSACKRWCMAMRWLARPEFPDLGLWPVPPRLLVVPLDTHVHRLAGWLGLRRRRAADWRTALEVTAGLRALWPDDPLRADLALAHLGISGACPARPDAPRDCARCPLRPACRVGRTGVPARAAGG